VFAHLRDEAIMSEQQEPNRGLASFLAVILTGMAAFFFLLVLLLLTGGLFFSLVLFFVFMAGLVTFHWVVWGKVLTELTAGEREEDELQKRAEGLHERASTPPAREEYRFRR
jgi:hypothetical protein